MEEPKKLYKSATDKKICGVCGGLAKFLTLDATILRLLFALMVVFCGTGIILYLVCALILPNEPTNGNTTVYQK